VSRLRLHALPAAALVLLVVADVLLGRGHAVLGLLVIAPLVAGTLLRRRATAVYAALALAAAVVLGVWDRLYSGDALAAQVFRLVGVAAGGVLALIAATLRQHRDRLLSEASREAAEARDAVALVDRLQRSLLTDPPPVPGLEFAVRYLPAVRAAQVGGDWYDAFGLPDGTTMLVIGDVAGHDVAAAATMAEARGVLRGIAQTLAGSPAAVLGALDRALDRLGDQTLITAVVATLSPGADGAVLRWANAGHPPPLLMDRDGVVQVLERSPDPLLGAQALEDRGDHELVLRCGDALLLYTDGLVERRDAPLDAGIAWLAGELPPFTHRPLGELCDALLAGTAAGREDDVAVLAARVTGRP
jgi:serine phosphatase RsbU (regulator of sigma subunit)